ncbi:hypothetical protein AJ79_08616 [Helicocarpus griseus UAMH5409]|uniref:Uncharacterized protein n=1 Tax=Helicocarpus griseus UAMH5409 TaxID=1447875 RepID=A0A2B7WIP7_9EURO|nr:hypothetical protein AJ79_08616 [Helicocarpus griseus UAMH5409]
MSNSVCWTTLLHVLCMLGGEEMVRLAIAKYGPGNSYPTDAALLYDHYRYTPLWRAAEAGSVGVLKLLIEAGADPAERIEGNPISALGIAIQKGHTAATEYLIDAGAAVTPSSNVQPFFTPLVQIVRAGNLHLLNRLLDVGGAPDEDALHSALLLASDSTNNVAIARRLLEAGARL